MAHQDNRPYAQCDDCDDHSSEFTYCSACGREIDRHGNTEDDFRNCAMPDCGCPEARLCMANNLPPKYKTEYAVVMRYEATGESEYVFLAPEDHELVWVTAPEETRRFEFQPDASLAAPRQSHYYGGLGIAYYRIDKEHPTGYLHGFVWTNAVPR